MRAFSLVLLALASLAAAKPSNRNSTIQAFDCGGLPQGLNKADCNHMTQIGMAGVGVNAHAANDGIWVGNDGPNTFKFTNNAKNPQVGITLIMWDFPAQDYEASFMNVRKPKISFSLPKPGDSVTISVANGISGAWSTLNGHNTVLSQFGQIYNTWGEFTSGDFATVDISREVNMRGNIQSVKVKSGCVTDMNTCVFKCKNGAKECGDSGSYELVNCDPAKNPNAATGSNDGGVNPEGGCMGWKNAGHLDISLGSN